MGSGIEDALKTCRYCKKEFTITADEQKEALSKGVEIERNYCLDCLKSWRRGEIKLDEK